MAQLTPSTGPIGAQRSIGLWIVLAIFTLGIATYVWTFKTHDEIQQHSGRGVGGILGFVLYFFFAPATFFLIPAEIRVMYLADGQESPVNWPWGFWVLLPLIGNIVWFLKMQGALND